MKRKNQPKRLLLSGMALPLSEGKAPSEFRLFRAGANDSDYGPITFDEKAAAAVMASHGKKGNPLFFDWNHGMMVPKEQRTREQGASAGRFELELRDGELWAVKCQWNAAGAAAVASREYELFSPAFSVDEEDGVTRPSQLLNCALVNLAGLDHIQPIAAGAAGDDDTNPGDDMTDAEIQKLRNDLASANEKIVTLEAKNAGRGILALSAILGLAADATDEARVSTVRGLVKVREDVLVLTGKTVEAEALGVLRGWKENAAEVTTIRAEAAEKATLALTAEYDGMLDKAVTDLKVTPAEKPSLRKAMLAGTKGVITAEGVTELKAYLETRQPVGKKPGEGPRAPAASEAGVITAEQKSLLTLHGLSLESATKALASEALYLEAKAAQQGRSA